MLLIAEKHITGGICYSVYRFAKSNNKYMKNYDKNKESSCLHYWDVNNGLVLQKVNRVIKFNQNN